MFQLLPARWKYIHARNHTAVEKLEEIWISSSEKWFHGECYLERLEPNLTNRQTAFQITGMCLSFELKLVSNTQEYIREEAFLKLLKTVKIGIICTKNMPHFLWRPFFKESLI
jgi:hypothetical protein